MDSQTGAAHLRATLGSNVDDRALAAMLALAGGNVRAVEAAWAAAAPAPGGQSSGEPTALIYVTTGIAGL